MDRQLRARWKKSQFDRLKTGPAHTEANKTELEQGCAFRVNAELWLAERTSRDPARSDLIGSTISCFWVGKNIETTGCKRKLAGPMSEVVIDRNNNILSLSLSLSTWTRECECVEPSCIPLLPVKMKTEEKVKRDGVKWSKD